MQIVHLKGGDILSVSSRLKEARIKRKLTQEQLGNMIGVAKSTIAGYESENSNPDVGKIVKLMEALNIDANYLWQDEMDYSESKNVPAWGGSILTAYARADDSTRRAACNVLQIPYVEPGEDCQNMRAMPVYLFPAAAGIPIYVEDDFEELEFPEDQIPKGANFGIRIRGDSMEPTIEDGTIVWVKRQQELQNGQIGVFMLHDEAVCKRFEKTQNGIRLLSDNESYAPIEIKDYETFGIVGRVLEYR